MLHVLHVLHVVCVEAALFYFVLIVIIKDGNCPFDCWCINMSHSHSLSLSLSPSHTHTHRTNGSLPCSPLSPKMSHSFVLKKQSKATGVSLIVRNPKVSREKERKVFLSLLFLCVFVSNY